MRPAAAQELLPPRDHARVLQGLLHELVVDDLVVQALGAALQEHADDVPLVMQRPGPKTRAGRASIGVFTPQNATACGGPVHGIEVARDAGARPTCR